MPKVSSSIFEAMDRVAKEAADTISKMSTNNNNDDASTDDNKVILASRTHGHDQGLFQKLEVSMRKIASVANFGVVVWILLQGVFIFWLAVLLEILTFQSSATEIWKFRKKTQVAWNRGNCSRLHL